jgi:isochorismate synthase
MIELKESDSFAIFRLPDDNVVYFIRQIIPHNIDFESKIFDRSGFIIFPFDIIHHKKVFISADEILINPSFKFTKEEETEISATSESEYNTISAKFIDEIEKGNFQKIVHSKIKTIENHGIDIAKLFQKIANSNKKAFVFLFNSPDTGTWLGATPEKLLTGNNNNYETTALAGTQFNDINASEEWSAKEIDEQAHVMDHIENILNNQGIKYIKNGPYTRIASQVDNKKLIHIASDYQFKLNTGIENLVMNLHPTPAVSGVPKDGAIHFIRDNEKHDRRYYSGFCGPVNVVENNEINLFVILRCMEIFKNKLLLYLGGGIVKGSRSEKEWLETENKAIILENVINSLVKKN